MTDAALRPAPRVDRVALAGAFVAAAGAILPFVEVRPNRLAAGEMRNLLVADAWGVVVAVLVVLAMAGAVSSSVRVRRLVITAAAWGIPAATAWALGAASEMLAAGQPSTLRVSIGAGVWVLLSGAAALGFSSARITPRGVRWTAAVLSGLAVVGAVVFGSAGELSLAREYVARSGQFWQAMGGHLVLTAAGLVGGLAIGVPLGVAAVRHRRLRAVALAVTGVVQTVPSLALLGLLVVPLAALGDAIPVLRDIGIRGIGAAPAIIALTLYALLPIVRTTYVGLTGVDPAAIDAGLGMGMSARQLLLRVRAPLALPVLATGVRTAAVLLIGIVPLTVFVGARNLGLLIFEGLGQFAPDLILLGSLPTIALAVVADALLAGIASALTPKGVRVA